MFDTAGQLVEGQQFPLFPDLPVNSNGGELACIDRSFSDTRTGEGNSYYVSSSGGWITSPNTAHGLVCDSSFTTDGFIFLRENQTALIQTTTATTSTGSHGLIISTADTIGGMIRISQSGVITTATSNIQIIYPSTVQQMPSPEELNRMRQEQNKQRLFNIQRAKGAIKRALKLIDNIGFGNDVRIFLGGQEIEVCHPDSPFKFVISKYPERSLIQSTLTPGYSTPYRLQLYTKTDVHIADLCVYMKDTPLLDQVLAIALYIKSGGEDDVLRKANWHSKNKDPEVLEEFIDTHPQYAEKLRFNREPFRQRRLFQLEDDYACLYSTGQIRSDWIGQNAINVIQSN